MNKKSLSESDICDRFITPSIVQSGWERTSGVANMPLPTAESLSAARWSLAASRSGLITSSFTNPTCRLPSLRQKTTTTRSALACSKGLHIRSPSMSHLCSLQMVMLFSFMTKPECQTLSKKRFLLTSSPHQMNSGRGTWRGSSSHPSQSPSSPVQIIRKSLEKNRAVTSNLPSTEQLKR